jgi:cytochrome P450
MSESGRLVDEERAASLCMSLLFAGLATTSDAIATSAYLASDHKVHRALRQDPARIPHAVEEFLRTVSPVQCIGRVVAQDCELGGVQMRRGDRVLVLYGSANRDESIFDSPEEFAIDPHRIDTSRSEPGYTAV